MISLVLSPHGQHLPLHLLSHLSRLIKLLLTLLVGLHGHLIPHQLFLSLTFPLGLSPLLLGKLAFLPGLFLFLPLLFTVTLGDERCLFPLVLLEHSTLLLDLVGGGARLSRSVGRRRVARGRSGRSSILGSLRQRGGGFARLQEVGRFLS